MKRVFWIYSFLVLLALDGFAQKRLLESAKNAFFSGNMRVAKNILDERKINTKGRTAAELWFLKGIIHLSEDTAQANSDRTSFMLALQAFNKATKIVDEPFLTISDHQGFIIRYEHTIKNYKRYYQKRAEEFYKNEDFEEAHENFDRWKIMNPTNVEAIMNAGISAQNANMIERAKENYDLALSMEIRSTELYVYYITLLTVYYGNHERALELTRQAIKLFQDNLPVNNYLKRTEINLLVKLNRREEVRPLLNEHLRVETDRPEMFFLKGVLLDDEGRYDEAREAYHQCLELDPKYFDAVFNLGLLELNEGIRLIEEQNELGTSRSDLLRSRDLDIAIDVALSAALPYWERASELQPENQDSFEVLQYIYAQKNMIAKAQSIYRDLEETGVNDAITSDSRVIEESDLSVLGFGFYPNSGLIKKGKRFNLKVTVVNNSRLTIRNSKFMLELPEEIYPIGISEPTKDLAPGQEVEVTFSMISDTEYLDNKFSVGLKVESAREQKLAAVFEAKFLDLTRLDMQKKYPSVGKNYLLSFAVKEYQDVQKWDALNNPISDSEKLAESLVDYGFESEIVRNPKKQQVLDKLSEYANKQFNEFDQLVITFSGHGEKDNVLDKRGYLVCNDSKGVSFGSYLSHNDFFSYINAMNCNNILVIVDACYSGLIQDVAKEQLFRSSNEDKSDPPLRPVYLSDKGKTDFLREQLTSKTRKYIVSGAEKVLDGTEGGISPFMNKFLEILDAGGGNDNILQYLEIIPEITKMSASKPLYGGFGSDVEESNFIFIKK